MLHRSLCKRLVHSGRQAKHPRNSAPGPHSDFAGPHTKAIGAGVYQLNTEKHNGYFEADP